MPFWGWGRRSGQLIRHVREVQAESLVNQLGLGRGRGGNDVLPGGAGVAEHRALAVQQRVADRRGREPALFLKLHPVGQVAHAGKGHVGDGQVRADAPGCPVIDRAHLQVVLGDAEALFHLPQPAVARQQFGDRHAAHVRRHPVKPVPAGGLGDPVRVDLPAPLALHAHEPCRAPGDQGLRLAASVELLQQLAHRAPAVGGVLSCPLRTVRDHDPAALVAEHPDPGAGVSAGHRPVAPDVEDPLLQRLGQVAQPRPDDVTVPGRLELGEVLLAEHRRVGHDHGLGPGVPAAHRLDRRQERVPFVGGAGKHLVTDRQPVARDHQRQHHLNPPGLAVLAVAERPQRVLAPVLGHRLEVQRRAIEKQHVQRLAQQRLGVRGHPRLEPPDELVVQPVHHPVDLLQRQGDAEIPAQPAHRVALGLRVGDARHDGVEQRRRRGPVTRGEQPIQAQLPVHAPVGLVDAGDDAPFLPQRLQIHPQRLGIGRLRFRPPGLDDLLGDLLRREQAGLALVPDARLQVLAQLLQPNQFGLVRGHPDMAHDALPDLAAGAHALDQLDGLAGAVGGGFDAHEHGGILPPLAAVSKSLGTTKRLRGTPEKNALENSKIEKSVSTARDSNRRSQDEAWILS